MLKAKIMLKIPKNFTKDTKARLTPEIMRILKSKNFKFDTHVHLFNKDYIPKKYFSIRMPFLVDTDFLMYLEDFIEQIPPEDHKIYYFAHFIDFVSNKSMQQIAEHLIENTPANTIFCPLMMDFSQSIEDSNTKDIFSQLDELKQIRDKYPDKFLPFVAIDPENKRHIELFEKAFSEEYKFFGIKIYPSLGYLPSHPSLMRIFELCEQYDIPVTAHCGSGNVHTTKSKMQLHYFKTDESGKIKLKRDKRFFLFKKHYEKYFNSPANWEPVLKTFPKLRLNLAHLGGDKTWYPNSDKKWIYRIIDFMERYENIYSDVSYIIHNPQMPTMFKQLFENNEIIQERTLFGTDYFMIFIEGRYDEIRTRFITEVGTKIMNKISIDNPLKFLNLQNFV